MRLGGASCIYNCGGTVAVVEGVLVRARNLSFGSMQYWVRQSGGKVFSKSADYVSTTYASVIVVLVIATV